MTKRQTTAATARAKARAAAHAGAQRQSKQPITQLQPPVLELLKDLMELLRNLAVPGALTILAGEIFHEPGRIGSVDVAQYVRWGVMAAAVMYAAAAVVYFIGKRRKVADTWLDVITTIALGLVLAILAEGVILGAAKTVDYLQSSKNATVERRSG